jgi:hypothetical protein
VPAPADHPLLSLSADDLNMVMAFVLASGSIKALAAEYGVSYPTMRQRLDGLIDRLRQRVNDPTHDPLSDYLASQIERGMLSVDVAREIRRLHRESLPAPTTPPARENAKETTP